MADFIELQLSGHETTAHSLSWAMYALMKDEELQKKCQQIMKDELSSHSSTIPWTEYCKRLPTYLEAVIKESMRKYPAVSRGSLRVVKANEGVVIPIGLANVGNKNHPTYPETVCIQKDTWIATSLFALQNSADNWGDDVEEFKPERWLTNSSSTGGLNLQSPAIYAGGSMNDVNSITFAPFSYGARNCIGMNMALMEIRVVFATLLSSYHFSFANDDLLDEKKALLTDFTLKPLNHLPVYVKKLSKAI